MGILVTAAAAIVLAISFDLSAIASIGSAVALVVFTLVTFGHLRIRHETGARTWLLLLANLTTVVVLVAFALTTLVEEPGTAVALVAILLLGIVLDFVWKRRRNSVRISGRRCLAQGRRSVVMSRHPVPESRIAAVHASLAGVYRRAACRSILGP